MKTKRVMRTVLFLAFGLSLSLLILTCNNGGGGGGGSDPVPTLPVPQNFTANAVSCGQVDLTWDLVDNATIYSIYRDGTIIGNATVPPYHDITVVEQTEYSYKITCSNESATSAQSAAQTIITPPCIPPSNPPTGLSSSSIGCNQIDLQWDSVTHATYYEIYRDGSLLDSSSTTNYSDTGLAQNTSYTYSLAACNSAGCSSQGTGVSFTTLNVPSTPSSPTISNQTCDSLTLSWSTVTGTSSYKVFRNSVEIGTTSSTTYTDTGLTKNTTYTYAIQACNDCGCSSKSSSNTGITTDIPGTPSAPSIGSATCNSLNINWTSVSGASSYKVYRDGVQVGSPATTSFTDTGLSPSTSYSYKISACNNCGCSAQGSSSSSSTTGIPNAPGAPSFPGKTCSSISLNWSSVSGASSYEVYRDGSLVTTTTLTSHTDNGLTSGTSYCYRIVACNDCGCSSQGTQACTSTTGIPSSPGAPSGSASCTSINLSWSSVSGADSYKVFRGGSQIASTSSISYNDTGLSMGTSYTYALQACNSCGCSSTGSSASYTTGNIPSVPSTPSVGSPGCSSLTISWSSVSGASSYKIYRGGSQIASPSSSPYTDSGLSPNTTYTYTIVACNSCGCSSQSNSRSGTTGSPACSSNPDCPSDGNECTDDICRNPGTCSSYCDYPNSSTSTQCGSNTSCSPSTGYNCYSECEVRWGFYDYHCNGSGGCDPYLSICGTTSRCDDGRKCAGFSCQTGSNYDDSSELNNSHGAAAQLTNTTDCLDSYFSSTKFMSDLGSGTERDFYKYHIIDSSCSNYPMVRISGYPTSEEINIIAYYVCDNGSTANVDCISGSPTNYSGYPGCSLSSTGQTTKTIVLDPCCTTLCAGDDSGTVYIYLSGRNLNAVCNSYELRWGDNP